MSEKIILKASYEVDFTHSAFFTGGQVEWLSDGSTLFCQCGSSIKVLDVATGQVTLTINPATKGEEQEIIITFALNSDDTTIVSYHKSGLFKLWSLPGGNLAKQWRSAHDGPVSRLALRGSILASGGIDSRVLLWDISSRECSHSLMGLSGVVSVLVFRPKIEGKPDEIFAAANDTVIRSWDITDGKKRAALSGHFSQISAVVFARDGVHMVSASRDRVLILWDLGTGAAVRTVPAYEALDGLVLLPATFRLPDADDDITTGINVASAGTNGVVRVWEMSGARELYVQQNSLVPKSSAEGALAVTRLLFNEPTGMLAVVAVDHNIMLHRLDTFRCQRQLVGYTDEILDVALLGADEAFAAVATNSADVKLYALADMGCRLLRGHADIVMALAAAPANPNLLLSSSKDNTVRLWLLDPASGDAACVGVGAGHTESVGAVAYARGAAGRFATAAQDSCLKLWTWSQRDGAVATHTALAHRSDINAVAFSPNDKIVATGSQDKTVKLWSGDNLRPLGTLSGHVRGVWSVAFSPFAQEIVSASADTTVRVWSLKTLSCLKSLQGHDAAVLRVAAICGGRQLLSTSADGQLRLWNVVDETCAKTMDHHDARIWAMTVSRDEKRVLTGGSDSQLVVWKDVTETEKKEVDAAKVLLLEQEQSLENLMRANQPLKALCLALTLERPLQALRIIRQVLLSGQEAALAACLAQLRADQKQTLMTTALLWNTNSRNVYAAQLVLSVLIDDLALGKLQVVAETIEDGLPYTERHFQRLTKLMQDVHLLEYAAVASQPTAKDIEKSG